MSNERKHWALLDERGLVYGMTVYQSLQAANSALNWCRKNLDSKLRIVELEIKGTA
jgi:phage protein U